MKHTPEQLRWIYDRTDGYCHLCGRKLAFKNFGRIGERGDWERDHNWTRADGGTDHLNNLYAACSYCNRSRGKRPARSVRAVSGLRRIPMSRRKREQKEERDAFVNDVLTAGLLFLGLVAFRMAVDSYGLGSGVPPSYSAAWVQ
jgi:hypothetical protein